MSDPIGICTICKKDIGGPLYGGPKAGILVGDRLVCHYCIARDPDRFPDHQDEVLPLLEMELEGYARAGQTILLDDALSRSNLERPEMERRAEEIQRLKPGLPPFGEGRIVDVDDVQRLLVNVSYHDHPFICAWEEIRVHEAVVDGERMMSDWIVEENRGISDLWVGSVPAFIVALCEVGSRFPDHLPFEDKSPDRWVRSVPRLSQDALDNIRDFFVLVGAVPEGTRFEMPE